MEKKAEDENAPQCGFCGSLMHASEGGKKWVCDCNRGWKPRGTKEFTINCPDLDCDGTWAAIGKSYQEAAKKHVCPVCEYEINDDDFRS